MGPKKQQPIKKREQKQNAKEVHNSIFADGEEQSRTQSENDAGSNLNDADNNLDENGDDKSEYIDSRFRATEKVTVYYTLPNGNEEILQNYPMVFADK